MNAFLIEAKLRLPDCDELVRQALTGGGGLNPAQVREVFDVLGSTDTQGALEIWQATKALFISRFKSEYEKNI